METLQLLVVGDVAVGKSCLISRLKGDAAACLPLIQPTIGLDLEHWVTTDAAQSIKVTTYEVSGDARFANLTNARYATADGILLVFDVTRPSTLDSVERRWLCEIDRHAVRADPHSAMADTPVWLVGNKTDMSREQPDPGVAATIQRIVRSGAVVGYIACSAFVWTPVLFATLYDDVLRRRPMHRLPRRPRSVPRMDELILVPPDNESPRWCCWH
jgi:small GTP-binding protein